MKNEKELKNKKISVRISQEHKEKLAKYCENHNTTISKLITAEIQKYLKED